jgi:outer membrane lipoprotein-sorting protein
MSLWIRTSIGVCALLAGHLLCTSLQGQVPPTPKEPAPETAPAAQKNEGHRLLEEIDRKIYMARKHDLQDLSFTFVPVGEDLLKPDFRIRYTWKRPDKEKVEFLDEGMRPLKELPPLARQFHDRFVSGAKAVGSLFVGLPYSQVYRDYRITVDRSIVNDREETTLVLIPGSRKRFSRIRITLSLEGLPAKFEKFTDEGGSFEQLHVYEKRGEEWLFTGFTQRTARDTSQELIEYQLVKGYYLPRQKSTKSVGDMNVDSTVVFENVKVNEGVADGFFAP